jgi:hypothetical protein
MKDLIWYNPPHIYASSLFTCFDEAETRKKQFSRKLWQEEIEKVKKKMRKGENGLGMII